MALFAVITAALPNYCHQNMHGGGVFVQFTLEFHVRCTVLCAKRVENGFLHTLGIISVILHAIHTCAENSADLPEHRFLAAIFLTVTSRVFCAVMMTMTMSTCFYRNRVVGVMASLHNVVLASFVAQVKSVMFYDLSVSGS